MPLDRGTRGAMHPPNLPKGPLLVTKWAKSGFFVRGLRGVRFKKSSFWVQKVHILGVLHPQSILATVLAMALSQINLHV